MYLYYQNAIVCTHTVACLHWMHVLKSSCVFIRDRGFIKHFELLLRPPSSLKPPYPGLLDALLSSHLPCSVLTECCVCMLCVPFFLGKPSVLKSLGDVSSVLTNIILAASPHPGNVTDAAKKISNKEDAIVMDTKLKIIEILQVSLLCSKREQNTALYTA